MTLTDIANIALEDLGQNAIGNIDGADFNARRLKRRICISIDTIQKKRNWVCLRRTVNLTRIGEKPNVDGEYGYIMPKQLLNVIKSSAPFFKRGDTIYSQFPELELLCTIGTYVPDEWDINLRDAIVAQVKRDMVGQIATDSNLITLVFNITGRTISECALNDAYDEKNRVLQTTQTWFDPMP